MRTKSEKLIILASRASVLVAVTLLTMKFYAWVMTGSMGILAALVDSLLDLCASLINMVAVRYAMEPADKEHRFGHGKAEALAGLGQATFIASSAIFLIIYTIDPIIAMLIGIYIFKSAYEIAYESVQLLLDRELPDEDQNKIMDIVLNHPFVIEVHDLRTRQSGQTKFIQFHMVLNGTITLLEAHKLSDLVHHSVQVAFPEADIFIHQDPHTEREKTDRFVTV